MHTVSLECRTSSNLYSQVRKHISFFRSSNKFVTPFSSTPFCHSTSPYEDFNQDAALLKK